jgi:RNA polymerase sigma-70 factor (ECF subfamily)
MKRQTRFERLYDDHVRAVLLYCRRRADPNVADDVTSETFLVAWRRLADVPDDPLPWLFTVAHKLLANHYRGEGRRRALHDRLTVEATRWVSSEPPESPTAEAIREAVAALPAPQREALMLVHWDGLTPAQAAEVLGGTSAAMRVRLHRARRQLARQLRAPAPPELRAPSFDNGGTP